MPAINKPNQHFDAVTYTGTAGTQTVSGLQFQPDFIWGKARSTTYSSALFDSVRGFGSAKGLVSNATQAEGTTSAQYGYVSTSTSTGFTAAAGNDSSNPNAALNESGVTYVAWNWKAGGTAVTNTSGTISAQVSANPTAGFSIVTYTGNGTAGATIGHGLGTAPNMIIVKNRGSGSDNWQTYHVSIGAAYRIFLNTVGAQVSDPTGAWNSGTPTSTVFTAGSNASVNGNGSTYVAYCWAPVSGYSAFSSYTGNGSTDGPFVYLGFRPRWLMIKRSSTASVTYGWQIYDAARQTYNTASSDPNLWADTSAAEGTGNYTFDLLSNGFKLRSSGVNENNSGDTYIYAAFAEAPFKFSNAK